AQAVAQALVHTPEIQAARARLAAVGGQAGQAQAEYLPSVNLAVGRGREMSDNPSTRPLGSDQALTRREGEITASQLLFDGGASGGQIRRLEARVEGAQYAVAASAESVALRAGQAFLDVRRLREQMEVARKNRAIHEHTLDDVRALAMGGRGRRADVVQAQARLALVNTSLEQLRGQLAQTEALYWILTGNEPGSLEPPASLVAALPERIEDALARAFRDHPDMRAAQKELEAAQHEHDSARARLYAPRLSLEVGATRQYDLDGIAGLNADRYAMLRLRYNVFRGFGDQERVREAAARIEEALAGVKRARRELERTSRQSWEALAADRARLAHMDAYARASAEVAEAYRAQFQLGQRSLLDLLNAENERFGALSGYIAAQAAVTLDEIQVLASLGGLLHALGLALPAPFEKGTLP
ncbi:MAG: TolC family outer membrane protein, partial [Betaproteobacteria bacterium]|nr:TolC family outer membrane protein [Betaproteobacteria bacterium]